MTEEMKMADHGHRGLVARMADVLSDLKAVPDIGGIRVGQMPRAAELSAADRRARLALRIAILSSQKSVPCTADTADDAPPAPDPVEPPVEPEPEPVTAPTPPPPPPPPKKPARVSLSTVRLEDAAFLLAAASTQPEPETDAPLKTPTPPTEETDAVATGVPAPAKPKFNGMKDAGDIFAAFSTMDTPTAEPEPVSTSMMEDTADASPEPPQPKPPTPKAKRRSGSVSALDGLANAAAALSALQMSDDEEPAPAGPPSAVDSSMAEGFAALRGTDE